MPISNWSTVAADNDDADATSGINFAEGQAPGSLNDSARAMMAQIKAWYDSINPIATGAAAFKKSELIDLAGLSQVDLTVPAGAVRVRLTYDLHQSTPSAHSVRVSTDGATFHAGAAAYNSAFVVSNSTPGTITAGPASTSSGFPLTGSGDSLAVPITGTALLSLVRPSTSRLFSWMSQAHVYDSATNGIRYAVFNGYLVAATTTDLTIQKVRIFAGAGTWVAGSVLVEWF